MVSTVMYEAVKFFHKLAEVNIHLSSTDTQETGMFWQFCPVNRHSLKSNHNVLMCFYFAHLTSAIKMYLVIRSSRLGGPVDHTGPKKTLISVRFPE